MVRDNGPQLCARQIAPGICIQGEVRPSLIVECQKLNDVAYVQLNKACLEVLAKSRKVRYGNGKAQLLGRAVKRDGAYDSIALVIFGQKRVPASAGIGRVLRIHDIVLVHEGEAIEAQQ